MIGITFKQFWSLKLLEDVNELKITVLMNSNYNHYWPAKVAYDKTFEIQEILFDDTNNTDDIKDWLNNINGYDKQIIGFKKYNDYNKPILEIFLEENLEETQERINKNKERNKILNEAVGKLDDFIINNYRNGIEVKNK